MKISEHFAIVKEFLLTAFVIKKSDMMFFKGVFRIFFLPKFLLDNKNLVKEFLFSLKSPTNFLFSALFLYLNEFAEICSKLDQIALIILLSSLAKFGPSNAVVVFCNLPSKFKKVPSFSVKALLGKIKFTFFNETLA